MSQSADGHKECFVRAPPAENACRTGAFKCACTNPTLVAVSFDLFGTLVAVDRPAAPADAVADALEDRGVAVPTDWSAAYREAHVSVPTGAQLPLPVHVSRALASRGVDASDSRVRRAVVEAFDGEVRTRTGASDALRAAADHGPVGLLSNCSVPGLVERTLDRAAVNTAVFDAVVTSVGCGWRKPDRRAFERVAEALAVPPTALLHVGDDPDADGGATAAGATPLLLSDCPLTDLPTRFEER